VRSDGIAFLKNLRQAGWPLHRKQLESHIAEKILIRSVVACGFLGTTDTGSVEGVVRDVIVL